MLNVDESEWAALLIRRLRNDVPGKFCEDEKRKQRVSYVASGRPGEGWGVKREQQACTEGLPALVRAGDAGDARVLAWAGRRGDQRGERRAQTAVACGKGRPIFVRMSTAGNAHVFSRRVGRRTRGAVEVEAATVVSARAAAAMVAEAVAGKRRGQEAAGLGQRGSRGRGGG
jgi:hypothetical protein